MPDRVGVGGKPEENFERLTLADGSELHAQRYIQFALHFENYKTTVLARVFPNFHEEFILGIPWPATENPTIDWANGRVTIE